MKHIVSILTLTILTLSPAHSQSVGEVLRSPDKAVPVVNQALSGTWMFELRRGGQPSTQPPVLLIIQFNGDGGITAAAGDGSQSAHQGAWLRVGDRRFLLSTFLFNFNDARSLTGITKIRANVQLSADGQTAKGTQEVVALDSSGKTLATIPGGTFTGTRLTPEIPGDFYSFVP